ADLRAKGRDECRRYGVTLVDAIVVHVSKNGDEHFTLELESRARIRGKRLLLAIGLRDAWPDIPGLEHVYGTDAHVCPDCDGVEEGTIVKDEHDSTSVCNSHGASNIVDGPHQAIGAAAEGAMAALAIH